MGVHVREGGATPVAGIRVAKQQTMVAHGMPYSRSPSVCVGGFGALGWVSGWVLGWTVGTLPMPTPEVMGVGVL